MNIVCENKKQVGATYVYPKFEGSYLFIDIYLDACIISCLVDGINNAFYTYPSRVEVRMEAKRK